MKLLQSTMLVSTLIFISCASNPILKEDDNFRQADLIGIVYESNNLPSYGAKIVVNGQSGKIYRTDINGRFIIARLKYGKHSITISKPEFESNKVDIDYVSRKQVVYVQLISIDTLLDEAEKAIDNLQWHKASGLLRRAEKINKENSRLISLQGALSYRTANYKEALSFWMSLIEKGHKDSYLYLIIADTYQFGMNQSRKAIPWLEKYLESRENEDIRNRMEELKISSQTGPVIP